MKIIKSYKILFFSLYFFYFIVFQILYHRWIAVIYGYQGFESDFKIQYFLASFVIISILLFLIKSIDRPSTIFLHISLLIILMPSLVLFSGQDNPPDFIFSTILSFLIISLVVRVVKIKPIILFGFGNEFILNLLLFISCGVLLGIVAFGGLQYFNLDLSKVYDIRRSAAEEIPGLFGYLNPITTKVFIPFGMVLALVYNKKIYIFIFMMLSFGFFALTAHKSPLLYPVVVLFFYYFGRSFKLVRSMLVTLILIIILSGLDFWFLEMVGGDFLGWFGALFSNRSLLVPAALNSMFINFFSTADVYYWSGSKISLGLVVRPYDLNAPNLIGLEFFGNADMSANTGWIGSGYANARYFGVMLYSFFIGLLFSLLDSYGKLIGTRIVTAMFALPILTLLTSADLTDMFLTHGLLFALFILTLLNYKDPVLLKNVK